MPRGTVIREHCRRRRRQLHQPNAARPWPTDDLSPSPNSSPAPPAGRSRTFGRRVTPSAPSSWAPPPARSTPSCTRSPRGSARATELSRAQLGGAAWRGRKFALDGLIEPAPALDFLPSSPSQPPVASSRVLCPVFCLPRSPLCFCYLYRSLVPAHSVAIDHCCLHQPTYCHMSTLPD